MHGSFLHDLAVVLGVAAGTTVLFRLLKQPSVLGYLFAGLLVGPHVPVPLFADVERMHALSEFGVVLVMFAIGLEFRIAHLFKVLPVSGVTALVQIGSLVWAGVTVGEWLGWTTVEALFLGASLGISSTMLVSKVFEANPPSDEVRSFVLGILVLQDVAAVVLIAVMTGVASGGGLSPSELALTLGRLAGFLLVLVAVGIVVVPRAMRAVVALGNEEVLVVVAVGACFALGVLAEAFGYSVALGAFIAGILVAESGHGHQVEHATKNLKDVFAAIFFVSIGMTIDPRLALEHLGTSLLVVGVVVVGQLLSVSIGGILSGGGLRRSITAGLALGQIGEFAFIISAIGVTAGVVDGRIQPILVTVAVVTAFTTPLVLAQTEAILHFVDHRLPHRLQNLIVFYESWFVRLRARAGADSVLRRAVRAVALDGLALIALVAAWYVFARPKADQVAAVFDGPGWSGHLAILAGVAVVAIPFGLGLVRNTRLVSDLLAAGVARGGTGPAAEATRALVRTTAVVLVTLAVGVPAAAILRPILHVPVVFVALLACLGVATVALWRRAGVVDEEVASGAARVTELLGKQRGQTPAHSPGPPPKPTPGPALPDLEAVALDANSPAAGRSLGDLDLRATTGASVLAIYRSSGLIMPTATDPLQAGDVLTLAGPAIARDKARASLTGSPADS